VRTGRRIQQAPTLPAFVLDERCPVSVVREFLGGLFGADGHAPGLHRWGECEEEATLEPPSYSQSTIPEHVEALKQVMDDVTRLLARCGVKTNGANVYEYPTRRATSSYPAAQDGIPRVEVRLELPDGLSFVERVGFRYCMDKALRASAAAVYWRLVDQIHRQRLWMSAPSGGGAPGRLRAIVLPCAQDSSGGADGTRGSSLLSLRTIGGPRPLFAAATTDGTQVPATA